MRKKGKILAVLAALVLAAVYYYVTLPAINIHASGFWMLLIAVLVLILFFYGVRRVHTVEERDQTK